jgi:hypothetical protein
VYIALTSRVVAFRAEERSKGFRFTSTNARTPRAVCHRSGCALFFTQKSRIFQQRHPSDAFDIPAPLFAEPKNAPAAQLLPNQPVTRGSRANLLPPREKPAVRAEGDP